MNLTAYTTHATLSAAQFAPLALPHTLWAAYRDYLWNYSPDSWVAATASAALVLAILICLPVVILGLLDIASYGIARTLGIIDDVKASTSDKATVHAARGAPAIHVSLSDSDSDAHAAPASATDSDREAPPPASGPGASALFYVGEGAASKLSGVGVFSPAASQPPSPTISRQSFQDPTEQLRHRTRQAR